MDKEILDKAKVNVLGTMYTVLVSKTDEEPLFETESAWALTNTALKTIQLNEDLFEQEEPLIKSTIRHELVHATLFESGLDANTFLAPGEAWATNETIVDWMAIQFPKLAKMYEHLGVNE